MKVIQELAEYLYNERDLLSHDEYDQVMGTVTPDWKTGKYSNYEDDWTYCDYLSQGGECDICKFLDNCLQHKMGSYSPEEVEEGLLEEQILEELNSHKRFRLQRKRRSAKPGLKQRRAGSLKPKDKAPLTLLDLIERISKRAPAWAPNLQVVAVLNRALDPDGFFRREHTEENAVPMYERMPLAPLLNRFSEPEVAAAVDGTLSERTLPAMTLVRFLSFKGPRNLVKLHRDKGNLAQSWILCCDETEPVRLDDPKSDLHTNDPWVLWANDIMNVQRLLLNVCCKIKENQATPAES